MRKLRLYLETSVWNFLFADDAPEKKDITKRFFKKIDEGRYEIFISQDVIDEIMATPDMKREALLESMHIYNPVILYRDAGTNELIVTYAANEVLSQRHMFDLIHLAVASTNDIDILLSWNMRHIARERTRMMVNVTNKSMGLKYLEIRTPKEMIDYEDS